MWYKVIDRAFHTESAAKEFAAQVIRDHGLLSDEVEIEKLRPEEYVEVDVFWKKDSNELLNWARNGMLSAFTLPLDGGDGNENLIPREQLGDLKDELEEFGLEYETHGEEETDYYLGFCQSPHGDRYWRISGDSDFPNESKDIFWNSVKRKFRIDAYDADHAAEIADANFDLEAWVNDGKIIHPETLEEFRETN